MYIKILQINLNHSSTAQDACVNYANQEDIDIVCIAEPYNVIENYKWIGKRGGRTAVYWNPRKYKGNIKTITTTNEYVIIKADEITIISVYISPNIVMKQTEKILDSITNEIAYIENKKNIIICGDFNAYSQNWGSKRETSRGTLINEWLTSLDLNIVNRGRTPTCIRKQGESIVDITIAAEEINKNIRKWRVIDQETLSDHRYIIIEINIGKNNNKQKENCDNHHIK